MSKGAKCAAIICMISSIRFSFSAIFCTALCTGAFEVCLISPCVLPVGGAFKMMPGLGCSTSIVCGALSSWIFVHALCKGSWIFVHALCKGSPKAMFVGASKRARFVSSGSRLVQDHTRCTH